MKSLFILMFLTTGITVSQTLPSWFINHPTGSSFFVGVVQTGYYKNSSYLFAFEKAAEKAAIYKNLKLNLKQSFILAIDKKYWTSFNKNFKYDTTLINYYTDFLTKIDSFQNSSLTMMLVSASNQNIIKNEWINISNVPRPEWTEVIPHSSTYLYSVGIAEEYYYYLSSWEVAENSAVLELAKSKFIDVNSVQLAEKSDFLNTILEFQDEKTETELNNIQIISRWFDTVNRIFYVLARCDKS